jgi:hypothetical protein
MLSLGQKLIAHVTLLALNTMFVFFFGIAAIVPMGFSAVVAGHIQRL